MRILMVEDEAVLRAAVARALRADGHAVDEVGSREAAEAAVEEADYGLVVLDRGLPDGDGLTSLRVWRRQGRAVPVLVLTARDAVSDRVDGLDGGADDYLVKPFDLDELRARVRSLSRRTPGMQPLVLSAADLTVDSARGEVRRGGVRLPLRAKELAVLTALLERKGQVVSRQRLRELCWEGDAPAASNVEEATLSSLRRKLGAPPLITTHRGLGYCLDG